MVWQEFRSYDGDDIDNNDSDNGIPTQIRLIFSYIYQ